jgi:lysophospholipase L1-like esterase
MTGAPGRAREKAGGRAGLKTWLGRLALAVCAPLFLFGLLEIAGWGLGVPLRYDNETYQSRHEMRICRFEPQHLEDFCSPQLFERAGESTSVFVFGGSSVEGHPKGVTLPFPYHLRRDLEQRFPGEYSVHNLGRACKDSIFLQSCFERVVEARPDIIVIYAGHNDFGAMMEPMPQVPIFIERHPWLVDLEYALARTHTYSLLIQLAASAGRESDRAWERLPDPQFERSKRIVLDEYARNIGAVVERAGHEGIQVILVTLVSNLYESPARYEWWDVATFTAESGELPEFMNAWWSHYSAGMAHWKARRLEEALEAFKEARDDLMKSRAPSDLNAHLREVAAANEHVQLLDFERILDGVGLEEGIGCNFFGVGDFSDRELGEGKAALDPNVTPEGDDPWCDQFHPNPRTQRMIADALLPALLSLREGGSVGR